MDLEITCSQPAAEALIALINAQYPDIQAVRCKYYARGLHDNYLVENETAKYILRLYRNAWRGTEDIAFELELLCFLHKQNARVSSPVHTREGRSHCLIDCREGQRMAALFDFADGYPPEREQLERISRLLGRAVADVHLVSTDFNARTSRPVLDTQYLLDRSVARVSPWLDTGQLQYLIRLQKKIHRSMPVIPLENGAFGPCAGDINFRNFHINERDEITLFDFDQCGYAYRAFELGKFLSSMYPLEEKNRCMEAFLQGYQDRRRLSEAEFQAIPYYEVISIIWVLTIYVDNADWIGHSLLGKRFWKQRIDRLKDLESGLPGCGQPLSRCERFD